MKPLTGEWVAKSGMRYEPLLGCVYDLYGMSVVFLLRYLNEITWVRA